MTPRPSSARALAFAFAFALASPSGSLLARASEPRRPLRREVCLAEEQPALTSLAVPARVRASAQRADLIQRARRPRRARRRLAPWLLVAAAAAAGAVVLVRTR